jgi:hypothetical protein
MDWVTARRAASAPTATPTTVVVRSRSQGHVTCARARAADFRSQGDGDWSGSAADAGGATKPGGEVTAQKTAGPRAATEASAGVCLADRATAR